MFESIIRYYNHNKKKFLIVIVVVISIIVMIQLANHILKIQAQEKANQYNNVNQIDTTLNEKSINTTQKDSMISDNSISTSQAQKNQNIIKQFISNCNNGNIELAYGMLSQNCKNQIFKTVEEFKIKYYDEVFKYKKTYNIENWLNSELGTTYKITYINDILSSGKNEANIQDYVTVVIEKEQYKLNILRYIGNENINKISTNNIVSIGVINKDIYDEYEVYNIRVTNKSNNIIMLNRHEDNGGIYVTYSGSNAKYTAFITQIYEYDLIIDQGETKYISVRINKMYDGNTDYKNIVFLDIINNKDEYDKSTNKLEYSNISKIEINL